MQGLVILLSVLSASAARYASSNNTPWYNHLTTSNKLAPNFGQRLICYDKPGCGKGPRITIRMTNVEDLDRYPYHFNNRIKSCKYDGIYILYDGKNYNRNNLNVSIKFCRGIVFDIKRSNCAIKLFFLIFS